MPGSFLGRYTKQGHSLPIRFPGENRRVDTTAAPAPPTMPTRARAPARPADISRVLELSVPVSVVLAERLMTIDTIVATQAGTIIEFEVPFDSDLCLFVANTEIGRGQAIKVGEKFGLRITQIGSVRERIAALRREN